MAQIGNGFVCENGDIFCLFLCAWCDMQEGMQLIRSILLRYSGMGLLDRCQHLSRK